MTGQEYQVPDLASVLRTLASFSTPATTPAPIQPPSQTQDPRPSPRSQPFNQNPAGEPQRAELSNTGLGPPKPMAPVAKLIDPATITEWSAGLRCVMKTVATHETIIREIRHMIKVQHEHEEQWWAGRQDLIKRQAGRKESQQKLDDVLRAVGGKVDTPKGLSTEEAFAEELKVFDQKVYRAQTQMVAEMSARLKGLGIPFFGTRKELVEKKGEVVEVRESEEMNGGRVFEDRAAKTKLIDELELLELQRRMIGMLEDLCHDISSY